MGHADILADIVKSKTCAESDLVVLSAAIREYEFPQPPRDSHVQRNGFSRALACGDASVAVVSMGRPLRWVDCGTPRQIVIARATRTL